MRKRWPWQWAMTGVLVLLVFGTHASARFWLPGVLTRLFGEVHNLAQAPPAMILPLGGYVVLSVIGGVLIGVCITDGPFARDQARRAQEAEIRRRLWVMEQQIREEHLSAQELAWQRRSRQQQAEITHEARRRLGMPEKEAHENSLL